MSPLIPLFFCSFFSLFILNVCYSYIENVFFQLFRHVPHHLFLSSLSFSLSLAPSSFPLKILDMPRIFIPTRQGHTMPFATRFFSSSSSFFLLMIRFFPLLLSEHRKQTNEWSNKNRSREKGRKNDPSQMAFGTLSRCFWRRGYPPADYSIALALLSCIYVYILSCNRYQHHQRKQQKFRSQLSSETNYCSITFLHHYDALILPPPPLSLGQID